MDKLTSVEKSVPVSAQNTIQKVMAQVFQSSQEPGGETGDKSKRRKQWKTVTFQLVAAPPVQMQR